MSEPVDNRSYQEKCQDPKFKKTTEYDSFRCDSSPVFEKCAKSIHKNHPQCQVASNPVPMYMGVINTVAKEIEFELKKIEAPSRDRFVTITIPGNRDPHASCEGKYPRGRMYNLLHDYPNVVHPLFISLKVRDKYSNPIKDAIFGEIVYCEDFDYINVNVNPVRMGPLRVAEMVDGWLRNES